jgi:hypothetical protein
MAQEQRVYLTPRPTPPPSPRKGLLGCNWGNPERESAMSKWAKCEQCGMDKEVPAFEGDGVFSLHICKPWANGPDDARSTRHYPNLEDAEGQG